MQDPQVVAWNNAQVVDPINERLGFRKDTCGAWVRRDDFQNFNSDFGWDIDYVVPKAKGGTDAPTNVRPLHWRNGQARRTDRLVCAVKSVADRNIALSVD